MIEFSKVFLPLAKCTVELTEVMVKPSRPSFRPSSLRGELLQVDTTPLNFVQIATSYVTLLLRHVSSLSLLATGLLVLVLKSSNKIPIFQV